MRRIELDDFGPLDTLRVAEAPDPEPGAGDVVIAVEAAGVNFVDALIVQGRYQFSPPMPFTPGSEVAGRVERVGADVTGLSVGDRVLASTGAGGYASHVVVAAADAVPLPENLTAGQAAALLQSYTTALYAFTRRITVRPDEWVAVLGAGGGVGLAATDVASALGAKVVACASTQDKLALAKAASAVATIAYEDTDLKTAIRDATGGGADVVVDPVGGDKAEPALRALRWDGRLLVIGFAGGDIPRLPANQILLNGRAVVGVELGGWVRRDPVGYRALIGELMDLIAAGRLHPIEPEARPLEDATEVLDALQSRRLAGKVVLRP
ncbi:MAG: NADPH:quinone oxidoreductase family protein [Actinomycetota bacterium]|nr:NADPH:quinone oxidoreductase family protein [Actinomycetota bacterium]